MNKWRQEWTPCQGLAERLNAKERIRRAKIEELIIVRTEMNVGERLHCLILYRFANEFHAPSSESVGNPIFAIGSLPIW